MVDDGGGEAGYEWPTQPLPLFAVKDWKGRRHLNRQTAQRPGSAGVSHSGRDGRTIDVVSHVPSVDHFDQLRVWARINILLHAADRAPGVPEAQRQAYRRAAVDLRRGRGSDVTLWEPVTIPVGGTETEFEAFRLVADFWCGIGRSSVLLTVHSHGVPLAGLSLISVKP